MRCYSLNESDILMRRLTPHLKYFLTEMNGLSISYCPAINEDMLVRRCVV